MPQISPELLALATPQELDAYALALETELALRSPADYAEIVSPHIPGPDGQFLRPPHIELLNQALVDLIEGRLGDRNLIVTLPPRHGKSHLISTYLPAWFLTRFPDRKVAVTTYEADFAASWGAKVRDLLLAAPEHLSTALNQATTAAARWFTKIGGGMFTAGAGGPLTGRGYHLGVVDDPFKNFEEAQSQTIRDRAENWFWSTFFTRREPGAKVVVLHTRWHEDDLIGRIVAKEPEKWLVIDLPALAKDDDPLGRAPGEALWPDRYSRDELLSYRESMGPQIFDSLFQQSPFVEGGGIFRAEKFRYFDRHGFGSDSFLRLSDGAGATKDVPEARITKFGVVDLAASTKTTADFSVFALFGLTPDKEMLLLDWFRARIEGADHMATLERLHGLWAPRFWGIERATFGLTLLQTAARTGRIPCRELKADFDKVSRAFAAGALAEAGRYYLPKGDSRVSDWVHEHVAFPQGAHDDMVDVSAYAAFLVSNKLFAPRRPKPGDPQTLDERIDAQMAKRHRKRPHGVLGRWP